MGKIPLLGQYVHGIASGYPHDNILVNHQVKQEVKVDLVVMF